MDIKSFFINDKNCTIIGLLSNFVLVLLKFLAGFFGKSQAMIADSLHSLSDGISTFIVYISLKYSQKPPDKYHPYGHGNIEVLVAMFVSLLILLTGMFLGYSAIHSIVHKHYLTAKPENITIYAALLSIIVKESLYNYTYFVGKILNSPMIKANAYEHRSDALSSIGALVSIVLAKNFFPLMDPVGSIIISLFIFKMGVGLLKENVFIVMDTTPSEKFQNEINNLIQSVNGVKDFSFTRVHPVGRHYFIETEIIVDKEITLEEAHKIAEDVKNILKSNNELIKDVVVHIEPKI